MSFLVEPLVLMTLIRAEQCPCMPDSICGWMWRYSGCMGDDTCDTDC